MAWTDRVQAAQQVMQAQRGLPERIASAEQALCDIRDSMAGLHSTLAGLPEAIGQSVRLSVKGTTVLTLTGTERRRIDNFEAVVGIAAYVSGAALAVAVSLQFGEDVATTGPAFKVACAGPVQSPEWISLSAAPASPVVVTLFTSWVGGWSVQ